MFARLFASGGLSFDRLRALLEVGAAGSISKAAGGDPVRQSQYSRQIKELEDFFSTKLIERHGKGIRLTQNGTELARIGRFFLLGLSNFQRGCEAEDQTFRIAAGETVLERFLMPLIASTSGKNSFRFSVETLPRDDIERSLHELTLDFGVVAGNEISRPLQSKRLGEWRLDLWVPRAAFKTDREAVTALNAKRLPMIVASRELDVFEIPSLMDIEPMIECDNFLQAAAAMQHSNAATLLPDFIRPDVSSPRLRCISGVIPRTFNYSLVWNPRLLRLNPRATKLRDSLATGLATAFSRATQ